MPESGTHESKKYREDKWRISSSAVVVENHSSGGRFEVAQREAAKDGVVSWRFFRNLAMNIPR